MAYQIPDQVDSKTVAEAFGFPKWETSLTALCDHGVIPNPVDKGTDPSNCCGWRWDRGQINTALAADTGVIAKAAEFVHRSIATGNGVPAFMPYDCGWQP